MGKIAVVVACLMLTVCAAPRGAADWAKPGADQAAASREAGHCRAQADAALAKEQGINEDISATLGRNWQLGRTTPVVDQSMRQQDASYADQVFNDCMHAKGFNKAG
jgi:hypothetical protein